MNGEVITIYKRVGETPLECLNRLRETNSRYKDAILSYAGRLDPLADGVMLVLVNDANKEREKYLHLDKKYEVEILFGITTDTYDELGIIASTSSTLPENKKQEVEKALKSFVKTFDQPYPVFSSKTLNGIPLFQLAKEKKHELEIPTKRVKISDIQVVEWKKITAQQLRNDIKTNIQKVNGDFRQDEILKKWEDYLNTSLIPEYQIVKIEVSCSSGTYMRSLAFELGKLMGYSTLAHRITRTQVGEYTINGLVG